MNTVAIYSRISDARDGDTAGVDRQQRLARELIEARGLAGTVVAYTDSNRSAMTGPRPAYRRLLADLRAGRISAVVVYSPDRLYRRLSSLEELLTALGDVPVFAVQSSDLRLDTADGRMIARILGAAAQREAEKLGERVSARAAERAAEGGWNGGVRRLGYNSDATALIDSEAEHIRAGYEFIAAGGSLNGLVKRWHAAGLRGPLGGRLEVMQVKDCLLRPMNAGLSSYKGQILAAPSLAPAIVEPALWWKVHGILTDPARAPRRGPQVNTLLSGIAVCGPCGEPLRGYVRNTRGVRTPAYRCKANMCVSRQRAGLDELVSTLAVTFLSEHADELRAHWAARGAAPDPVTGERERIARDLATLADLLGSGAMDATAYGAATTALSKRLQGLPDPPIPSGPGTATLALLGTPGDVGEAWAAATVDARRAVLRELMVVVVDRAPGRSKEFTSEGIAVRWLV